MRNLILLPLMTFAAAYGALGQTTNYPTQPRPTQPLPTSPCTTSAPCPPPAASQPDTPAPPPSRRTGAPPAQQGSTDQRRAPALGARRVVSGGTTINAKLDSALSKRSSHPGDNFTATITEPVLGASGEPLIPPGAKIHGEVVQGTENAASGLAVRFTTLTMPAGISAPLSATLTSAQPPSPAGSQNLTVTETEGGGTIVAGAGHVDLQPGSTLQLRLDRDLSIPLPKD